MLLGSLHVVGCHMPPGPLIFFGRPLVTPLQVVAVTPSVTGRVLASTVSFAKKKIQLRAG